MESLGLSKNDANSTRIKGATSKSRSTRKMAIKPWIYLCVWCTLLSVILEAFSMGIFGIGAYYVYECSINSWVANFEWAFYVGICGLAACLFASLSYFYAGYSIREEYKGYDPFSYNYRA